jgi:hypothetical protein
VNLCCYLHSILRKSKSLALLALAAFSASPALAGGPKFVAGVSYFNPAVLGQPAVWNSGQVSYFVDQGPLNAQVSQAQATAMVDAAAAVWNGVPTAAVNLTDGGALAEDVNGSNVLAANGSFAQPADVTPAATGTPVAVIYDADGSAIDALEGTGASQPDNCSQNSVLVWIDNINPNATLAHGVIVLNGRCATSSSLLAMMSYQLERAFGRILGLDFSQVNSGALTNNSSESSVLLGWPVMQPESGACGEAGGVCIPNPGRLRFDDIASLNRLYPVTSANLASFPGKVLTAANTVSIQGTISFRSGEGMQGVNVVARPLDSNGNPMYQYTVTFVSGGYFCGNHGNAVTGWTDENGNRFDRFGSNATAMQGYFDLSGIPLPPGVTLANYQVTFEAVNPLYINAASVGPYVQGSPAPSGVLAPVTVANMTAGSMQTLTVGAANSASDMASGRTQAPGKGIVKAHGPGSIGLEGSPAILPSSGMWSSRLSQIAQNDWFVLPVRGNRLFTVVTQALDESGNPSAVKAMPSLGVWDGFDQVGTSAVGFASAQNGIAVGETWLQVATAGNDIVRLAIADQRGDGRPDYTYRGWVLYADSVSPARLPLTGGSIVIRGMGFRPGDTVQVGGVAAQVTSITPNEITAVVPASASGTGSVDVEVDDLPQFYAKAVIPGGVSYDSGSGDALNLLTAPQNQVPMNVPQPFSVVALGANLQPAGGVKVTYAVTAGTATLGCGQSTCAVTSSGDGRATMAVTATNGSLAIVTVSLTNGASLQAQFYGGAAPALSALTPTLYLAAGATASWPVQALALSGGTAAAGQSIAWQSATGITAPAQAVTTGAAGTASVTLAVSALAEGQTATSMACLNGGSTCAAFNVFGSRPEYATLASISGTSQNLAASGTPAVVSLRVLDMNGNPMAGGTVTVHQALYAWAPACPRHGRCAQPQLLANQSTTVTSALDGSVSITPLTLPGVATNLVGLAATGNAGSLSFAVEQHP